MSLNDVFIYISVSIFNNYLTFIDNIIFAYYDTSIQDLPKELDEYRKQPVYVFYPMDREPLDPLEPDDMGTLKIMKYIHKHTRTEIDLPNFAHLSENEYSQSKLGQKISADDVIEADQKLRDKMIIKEDL